jgi:dipeptidase
MIPIVAASLAVSLALPYTPALACTNYLVTKGASADGSTMITYAADSHVLYGELYFTPAGKHAPGSRLDVYEWDTGKLLGQIDQVPETYTVVGNMNEHQVSIGETTWGGRAELEDPEAVVDYGSLMYIALQRAKTAREAIQAMTGLVAEYGYYSSGESFSIADPEEVWLMEIIGKGPGNKGAVWVARKIPDGYISAHANAPRIRQFPQDDPENTLFADDVISFAREKGYFDGEDADFSFADTYDPANFGARRFCDARVWCMYRRAAPSNEIPEDWALGLEEAEPLPLWIKPDHKLTVADVMSYMRDHFEETPLDMTQDIGAGPYELPYRWRPLTWKAGEEKQKHFNERAVSTQQTGFSFVAQARSWLPHPIGGVLWFGVDDTFSTVYFPMYCGANRVPHNFAVGTGSFDDVTWDSAFWVFNQVSNFAYLRYSDMIKDIQVAQRELESSFLAAQPEIDSAALALHERSPRLAKDYLTDFSVQAGDSVVERWQELSKFLLYKYLDGNVKDANGKVTHPGYPESWYEMVAEATGDHLQARKLAPERAAEEKKKMKARKTGESILTLLEARGIEMDSEATARVQDSEDVGQLTEWLVRAATADSAEAVFGEGE